jgi:hypothetical protein
MVWMNAHEGKLLLNQCINQILYLVGEFRPEHRPEGYLLITESMAGANEIEESTHEKYRLLAISGFHRIEE